MKKVVNHSGFCFSVRLISVFLTLCLLFTGNALTVSAVADGMSSGLEHTRTLEELLSDLGSAKTFTQAEKRLLHEYLITNAETSSAHSAITFQESDFLPASSGRETVTVRIAPDGTRTSTSTAYPEPTVTDDRIDRPSSDMGGATPEEKIPIPFALEMTENSSVSLNSGSSQYTVPLFSLPGVNGNGLNLALSYSSADAAFQTPFVGQTGGDLYESYNGIVKKLLLPIFLISAAVGRMISPIILLRIPMMMTFSTIRMFIIFPAKAF